MLKRLYSYWRPARGDTAAGMALLLIAGALELLQPWPVKWLVDCVFGSQPMPHWLRTLWPAVAHGDRATGIAGVCFAIVLLATAYKLAHLLSQTLLIRAGLKMVRNLRVHVCDHLHRLPLAFHDKSKVGDLTYRAAWDSYAAQSLLSQGVAPAATGVLILIGILFVMVRLDLVLTAIALAIAPAFWLLIKLFGRAIAQRSKRYQDQESALYCTMQESLSSIRAIQAFNQEGPMARRVDGEASRSFELNQRLAFTQLAFTFCVGLAMALGTAAVVYVGARRVVEGRLMLGDVLVFLAYTAMLYTPISAFAQSSGVLQSARTQLRRVFDVLDITSDLTDRPGALAPARVAGRVTFEAVSFAYEPGQDVLRHVTAAIEPGTVVALVGRTGSGKTTIASLLLRFYDPTAGVILLDGNDLRNLKLDWLRRNIGVVLQDAILFSGTIAENIAIGRAGATQAEIEVAAARAQADEFIRALPQGYDTVLGERGVNLSGGQRQRISIARAFLKDAPILILDEPTSALDTRTEAALVHALHDLMQGRTTFIIAHRLSTVRAADVVWVLQDGRIVETGSHDQLLAGDTLYRQLCNQDSGSPEDAVVMP
ncbi:MAG: transporter related [Phycisphaerales bacterium]|nr:transporter related [Phycisphaerales bacterium]